MNNVIKSANSCNKKYFYSKVDVSKIHFVFLNSTENYNFVHQTFSKHVTISIWTFYFAIVQDCWPVTDFIKRQEDNTFSQFQKHTAGGYSYTIAGVLTLFEWRSYFVTDRGERGGLLAEIQRTTQGAGGLSPCDWPRMPIAQAFWVDRRIEHPSPLCNSICFIGVVGFATK